MVAFLVGMLATQWVPIENDGKLVWTPLGLHGEATKLVVGGKSLQYLVGTRGFEPRTSCTPSKKYQSLTSAPLMITQDLAEVVLDSSWHHRPFLWPLDSRWTPVRLHIEVPNSRLFRALARG